METFMIIFDPLDGYAVPDGQINDWIDEIVAKPCWYERTLYIGSETMLYELRARHKEGRLRISRIKFRDKDSNVTDIDIDDRGKLNKNVDGFADFSTKALFRLLQ